METRTKRNDRVLTLEGNNMINKENYSIDAFHKVPAVSDSDSLGVQRESHLVKACQTCTIEGSVLEFGVHKGKTINVMSKVFPNDTLYGFDSFEGLPEDWNISTNPKKNKHKKGYFAVDKLPSVSKNVELVKGFFDTSLPKWLEDNNPKPIKLLHVDSDLYSSAKTVLTLLNDSIVKDTIIVFDEFYAWGRKRYETWEDHEYKALHEWITDFDREFEVLYRSNHQQCSIRITK